MKQFINLLTVRFAYGKAGKPLGWPKLLPRNQPTRLKKLDRKPKKEIIPNLVPISNRPSIIDGRAQIEHWEGDLVIFTLLKSNNLTTLVERAPRFAKLVCNYGKTTAVKPLLLWLRALRKFLKKCQKLRFNQLLLIEELNFVHIKNLE